MAAGIEQKHSVVIEASQQECFDVITDFESYPEWNGNLSAASIEKTSRGVARQVAFEMDARVKAIRYVLEYTQKKPTSLRWHSVAGDVSEISGHYTFKKLGPTRTEATCVQCIDLGFWLPGPVRRLAENTALKQSLGELKTETERRRKKKKRR